MCSYRRYISFRGSLCPLAGIIKRRIDKEAWVIFAPSLTTCWLASHLQLGRVFVVASSTKAPLHTFPFPFPLGHSRCQLNTSKKNPFAGYKQKTLEIKTNSHFSVLRCCPIYRVTMKLQMWRIFTSSIIKIIQKRKFCRFDIFLNWHHLSRIIMLWWRQNLAPSRHSSNEVIYSVFDFIY